ncbi:MAG: NAD(P)H-hydrate dehydratase [Nitrospirae bacterium]|nr:NAD(P)H-hydrate dehydratase [Candidatus Manganitrophaceae bacterium]
MKIVTAEEMKQLDRKATTDYAIPSLLLMENAARGLVDEIERTIAPVRGKRVLILAGRGNNGGDGIAAARHFRMRGGAATVYLLSPIEKVTGDARISLDIWMQSGGALQVIGSFRWNHLVRELAESDLIIDALLGTGLSHPVEGDFAKAITLMNQSEGLHPAVRPIVAIDIPSGISADTGEILGTAVKADFTFTMALPKRGHYLQEGLEYRGKLGIVDIGFPPALIEAAKIPIDLITPAQLIGFPPPRPRGAHKGTAGHLLIIAGSLGKKGAALLSSRAALRCGAGLVTVALPKSIDPATAGLLEAMTFPLPETEEGTISLASEKRLADAIEGKEGVAIGPGLSQNEETQRLIRTVVAETAQPIVVDADGLNALAGDLSVLKRRKTPAILTPHPGEMGRLTGKSAAEIQKERFTVAAAFAEQWNAIVVLKGAHTLIAAPDGSVRVNNTGNPGMATAGMGDALTGMIGAWLAQGVAPLDAATWGVALHGHAGDLAAAARGEIGLITSDLIEKIPEAIQTLRALPEKRNRSTEGRDGKAARD